MKHVLITGGAGFIGANFILDWLKNEKSPVVNLDKLTYAGNLENLKDIVEPAAVSWWPPRLLGPATFGSVPV